MQQSGYICENGNTHGNLIKLAVTRMTIRLLNAREVLGRLLWRIPADVDDLLILIKGINCHWHVVVCGYNLWFTD